MSSLLISSVANAKWTQVVKTHDGNTHYVDFERIKKHDGKVYHWGLTDYLKPDKYGVISTKEYKEAEYGRFRYKFLSQTSYKDPMGSGVIAYEYNIPMKDWVYPQPYTAAEATLKAVCNHKSMQ
jgi:hypothetical protein